MTPKIAAPRVREGHALASGLGLDEVAAWLESMVQPCSSGTATAAEIQSGMDRQKWAENLILQLPITHNGRNSWLLNYGRGEFAQTLRKDRELLFNELSQAVNPPAQSIPVAQAARMREALELIQKQAIERGSFTIERNSGAMIVIANALSSVPSTEGK